MRRRKDTRGDLARRLKALVDLVDQAILAQPDAESVIADCCRPGDASAAVARRGGRIISEYAYLHESAVELLGDEGPGTLPQRVIELLMYHAETVDEALKLAFPRFPCATWQGHQHAGLGVPARTLREARVALEMWIGELADD
ncbi:hypothetical protein [Actinocrispum wychmicini]|uniref:Uncharacterized protein n=1 Tax=Actinocrispum wychmicini TaxID=1213861 RepID=A0A4R2JAM1_9PSEU|nr:hypothetical protein [Actinocrispum wychmicini]TCO53708.1 hypothetical protein EV192_110298 [Actinocrispum wychmicini]